ncbi:MAG: glycoside hydrolase family 88 protein [Opitutaceae bacterium]
MHSAPLTIEEVTEVLVRVRDYLAANTPARLVHSVHGTEIAAHPDSDAVLERGVFNVAAYQFGMVYAGMLAVAETTGDATFRDYAERRISFLVRTAPWYRDAPADGFAAGAAFRALNHPRALDDAGIMAATMIKAHRAGIGIGTGMELVFERLVAWVHTGQERLADGTLTRSQPQPQTVWLDDLYMSVPALAQMGKRTGDGKYFDDAVKQVTQFAARLFNREKGLWFHAWVEGMTEHPELRWARANGWATMAMSELLEVLPANHPGRAAVLEIFRAHVRGVAAHQSADGRWHQLLDRPETYLETSASAMLTFGIARGVNRGWIDATTYAPVAVKAWRGVAAQVNSRGQIENVCVGTGVSFDPAFYATRPVSAVAPHGPGPVLLAGAEMVILAKSGRAMINDGALMFGRPTGMERE